MKKALITGGSGDIGSALCQRLAGENIHVIVHSNHNLDKAQSIADTINQGGGSAEACAFDVCDAIGTETTLKKLSESGLIQIIINNAGIHRDAPLAGMSRENWSKVIDVSLNGFYNVTQPLLMPMIQSRWGRIINMSSIAGVMGNRGQCNYSAAKAALNGATKSLAQELASRKITVNAIAPGIIQGSMTENSFDAQAIKNIVPMKRAGKPEEVAALAAFLCSDEASYISGQIININGAMA
ncbi:MAG TPA: 3-oxoacyl-ACP reductase FabG [Methyloprofundus sp.]|uniref:3-oxoacyl-ACP reductase FabG n=1 Tax=Methyloprofundus sp. TaxID=2020875 RepID=UPI0018324AFB|nr:3-oxoacyl-ACP reductase FabG [Methyloprofundus sp.]HIG65795.1 3-oxoacyl-ACP reductase FabG [Methyloprofundus sp.]HIL78083.1 3-oxoacyl-ACP reductase FabG [Methylococcales bacterium]